MMVRFYGCNGRLTISVMALFGWCLKLNGDMLDTMFSHFGADGGFELLWFFAGCHDMQSGVIINAVHTPKVEMM